MGCRACCCRQLLFGSRMATDLWRLDRREILALVHQFLQNEGHLGAAKELDAELCEVGAAPSVPVRQLEHLLNLALSHA